MVEWGEYQDKSLILLDETFRFHYALFPFSPEGDPRSTRSAELFSSAIAEMERIEAGELVNTDEGRMVGHYWLRAPELAPNPEIREEIEREQQHVLRFASAVAEGKPRVFRSLLVIGIGGSALGPQLLADAFAYAGQPMNFFSLDNTDPDGIARVLAALPKLDETLVLVVSKSGGTKETRNAMVLTERAFQKAGLEFAQHAVAVTGEGSLLHEKAAEEGWLDVFPMWDWVGGRTSLWSSVGLLPCALLGIDTVKLLEGAADMDCATRSEELLKNPAAILALCWREVSATKDMIVLPYRDRILLLSRYLQQLVMESLGKEYDRNGNTVEEGLSVFGNKGSTDQHAYIQQLRDGRRNFFAVFVEVLRDYAVLPTQSTHSREALEEVCRGEVEEGVTSADYLHGFALGTRRALAEQDRPSLTIVLEELSPYSIGALLALFERAVTFYASFANINAYHQPGVEAGKVAAAEIIKLQGRICNLLQREGGGMSVAAIVDKLGGDEYIHTFEILERLAACGKVEAIDGATPFERCYRSR
ncbi:glucose-6-phosphate isomerase [bacterium]|nr:glucose-6-phosphate isomerase [bacterium]